MSQMQFWEHKLRSNTLDLNGLNPDTVAAKIKQPTDLCVKELDSYLILFTSSLTVPIEIYMIS